MAQYAAFCDKCGEFSDVQWGAKTCPKCGYKKLNVSRVDSNQFHYMSKEDQYNVFDLNLDTIDEDRLARVQEEEDAQKSIEEQQAKNDAAIEYANRFRSRMVDMEHIFSINDMYEYDICVVRDTMSGSANIEGINKTLNEYASKGWRLKAIYSNELGKNSIAGINSTIDQAVMIFERRIKKSDNL